MKYNLKLSSIQKMVTLHLMCMRVSQSNRWCKRRHTHSRAHAWNAVSSKFQMCFIHFSIFFVLYLVFYHLDHNVDTIASFIVTLNIEQEHNVFSSYFFLLSSFAPVSCARVRSNQLDATRMWSKLWFVYFCCMFQLNRRAKYI